MTNLKALRKESSKSQQEVADYLGCSRQAYGNYENNLRTMDYETLLKLAEFFDTSVDLILRGNENSPTGTGRAVSDNDIKFALFDGEKGITDEQYEEVKQFAKFVRERDEKRGK